MPRIRTHSHSPRIHTYPRSYSSRPLTHPRHTCLHAFAHTIHAYYDHHTPPLLRSERGHSAAHSDTLSSIYLLVHTARHAHHIHAHPFAYSSAVRSTQTLCSSRSTSLHPFHSRVATGSKDKRKLVRWSRWFAGAAHDEKTWPKFWIFFGSEPLTTKQT